MPGSTVNSFQQWVYPFKMYSHLKFSYLLENHAKASCLLYILHSLNYNFSLFNRISTFGGCLGFFCRGERGHLLRFGFFICFFGGSNTHSSFCKFVGKKRHFEEISIFLWGDKRFSEGLPTHFAFLLIKENIRRIYWKYLPSDFTLVPHTYLHWDLKLFIPLQAMIFSDHKS